MRPSIALRSPIFGFDRASIAYAIGLRSGFYRLRSGCVRSPPIPPRRDRSALLGLGGPRLPSLKEGRAGKREPLHCPLMAHNKDNAETENLRSDRRRIEASAKRCRPIARSPQIITVMAAPATDLADTVQTRVAALPRNAYFAVLPAVGPVTTDHGKRFSPTPAAPRRTQVKPKRRTQCECLFLIGRMEKDPAGGWVAADSDRARDLRLNLLARGFSGNFWAVLVRCSRIAFPVLVVPEVQMKKPIHFEEQVVVRIARPLRTELESLARADGFNSLSKELRKILVDYAAARVLDREAKLANETGRP
jgi:hypothetical protein